MRTNDATYTDLMKIRDRLELRHTELKGELEDVTRKLESVSMTLALLDDGETVTPTPMSIPTHRVELMHGGEVRTYAHVAPSGSVDVASLRGMTQIKALEKIARHNGGRLLTSDAKRYLVQAGLIKNPKNANNIIFSVIQRSNQFERLEPGVYRLTADKPIRPDKTLTGSLGLE